MSVMSGTLGFGGGTGLVVVGLLMSGDAGYHRVFWLTTAFTILVIAIVVVVVPARPRTRAERSTGSVPPVWPPGCRRSCWRSRRATRGVGRRRRRSAARWAGVTVSAGWWWWERRAKQPLVSTRMLTRRPMLLTNLATVFVGMGLYFAFLGADAVRPNSARDSGIRVLSEGPGSQRRLLTAGCGHRLSRRNDQRPVHRPLRRPAGARRRGGRRHRRVPVHRSRS